MSIIRFAYCHGQVVGIAVGGTIIERNNSADTVWKKRSHKTWSYTDDISEDEILNSIKHAPVILYDSRFWDSIFKVAYIQIECHSKLNQGEYRIDPRDGTWGYKTIQGDYVCGGASERSVGPFKLDPHNPTTELEREIVEKLTILNKMPDKEEPLTRFQLSTCGNYMRVSEEHAYNRDGLKVSAKGKTWTDDDVNDWIEPFIQNISDLIPDFDKLCNSYGCKNRHSYDLLESRMYVSLGPYVTLIYFKYNNEMYVFTPAGAVVPYHDIIIPSWTVGTDIDGKHGQVIKKWIASQKSTPASTNVTDPINTTIAISTCGNYIQLGNEYYDVNGYKFYGKPVTTNFETIIFEVIFPSYKIHKFLANIKDSDLSWIPNKCAYGNPYPDMYYFSDDGISLTGSSALFKHDNCVWVTDGKGPCRRATDSDLKPVVYITRNIEGYWPDRVREHVAQLEKAKGIISELIEECIPTIKKSEPTHLEVVTKRKEVRVSLSQTPTHLKLKVKKQPKRVPLTDPRGV